MIKAKNLDTRRSIRRHVVTASLGLVFLIGGVGGLGANVELSGAVVASGVIVVDQNVKKVQHPSGGVIGEIRVRNGARVRAGDILLRLDETIARANLAIVEKGLDELAARRSRLEAERDSADELAVQTRLQSRGALPDVAELVQGEAKLFKARRDARDGQIRQLKERLDQTREQISGLELQAASKAEEISLIGEELKGVEKLFRSQLVPITRVTGLRREKTRLSGERGQLISDMAQARGRISEIGQQIIQIGQDLRSEVSKELREIQAKQAELVERKVAAEDALNRIDVQAPQDGVVHQLAVFNAGGVIGAGETIMLIVPNGEDLLIEAKVPPQDIDQIQVGQSALVRLSAFNQRTTPEVTGEVKLVPADVVTDTRSGAQYYPVRISLDAEARKSVSHVKLVPGMPAEVFVQTGYRTILSYLSKPLKDQFERAFKQD